MDYFDKATIDQIIQSYEEYKVLANRIMSEYCENERDWSISCLKVRFEYLATNNEEQWLFTALTQWYLLPWTVLFGPLVALIAFGMTFVPLLSPYALYNYENALDLDDNNINWWY